jgi:hypothetical protein
LIFIGMSILERPLKVSQRKDTILAHDVSFCATEMHISVYRGTPVCTRIMAVPATALAACIRRAF